MAIFSAEEVVSASLTSPLGLKDGPPTLNMWGGFLGCNMAIPLDLRGEMKTYGHPQACMNIYRVVFITDKNSKQLKFSSLCEEITN